MNLLNILLDYSGNQNDMMNICKYSKHKEVKLSCVGSVAFYYSNILRAVAANKGVNIETIIETPIAGLTLYHLGEE